MTARQVQQILPGMETSDGAGVRLRRALGGRQGERLDPLLMLDAFSSDDPDDYIAGFPAHPHRGFETVTYILDGHMLHEDHLGNRGDLTAGGVQWMTAGRGIIHSEMPQQTNGRLRGFQLWINLPARDKMQPAGYRDIPASEIPTRALGAGITCKLIAGELALPDGVLRGPIVTAATSPLYVDLEFSADTALDLPLPPQHNVLVHVFEGTLTVADRAVPAGDSAVLSLGDTLGLSATQGPARCLVIGGRPLGEPVAQYGPFVMNTRAEIEQAVRDYQAGRLCA